MKKFFLFVVDADGSPLFYVCEPELFRDWERNGTFDAMFSWLCDNDTEKGMHRFTDPNSMMAFMAKEHATFEDKTFSTVAY